MKTICKISILLFFVVFVSCGGNNDSGSRTTDEIKVFINGATTPDEYSTNVVAKEIPLSPMSGFSSTFKISSVDASNNPFELSFLPSNVSPYVVTTPTSEVLTGAISSRLTISNIVFDDAASNNLTITYNTFGSTIGSAIDISISGVYYETGNTTPQNLNVTIQVNRQ